MQAALPTTSTLADFTSAQLILPDLQERTTIGVINDLNHVLHINKELPEHLFATAAAINHELLTSMRLDGGMIIAQMRLATLPRTRFALGRAKEPLPWRASRLTPITFVVLVLAPSSKPIECQRVVEALNALAHHTQELKLMREADGADEMLAILGEVS